MPRNQRQWAKRKLFMASGNLDTAMEHLLEVAEIYKPDLMQYAEMAEGIAESLLAIQSLIGDLHGHI